MCKRKIQAMRFRLLRRRGLVISLTLVCLTLLATRLKTAFNIDNTLHYQDIHAFSRITVSNLTHKEIAARFAERRQRVKEACRRLNISTGYLGLRHADQRFIFPTNSSPIVLYCPVPKTGTTFLKKTFAGGQQAEQGDLDRSFHVRPVSDYDKALMFFLPAYVDKLFSPNLHFWRVLGKTLVKIIRPNATLDSLECGHDVTFPEFIRYFIVGLTQKFRINTHLVPTHKFCEACKYDYDYIGHLETFREDAAFILAAINVTSPQNVNNDNDVIMDHIIQAFYTNFIDKRHCDKKHNLLLRAWRALQIRGLISMSIAFPFSEFMSKALGKAMFTKAVYKAVKRSNQLLTSLDKRHNISQPEDKSRDITSSQLKHALAARMLQKRMALASAYSLIPMADRLKLMQLLKEEFELFGYEPLPSDVFSPDFSLNPNIFDLSNI